MYRTESVCEVCSREVVVWMGMESFWQPCGELNLWKTDLEASLPVVREHLRYSEVLILKEKKERQRQQTELVVYTVWIVVQLNVLVHLVIMFCEWKWTSVHFSVKKKKNIGILPVTVLWPLGISCLLTKSCLILRRIWVWRPELCGSLHQVTKYTLMILRTWGCI